MRILKSVKGNEIPQIRFYIDTESTGVALADGSSERHTFRLGSAWLVRNESHGHTSKNVYELWQTTDLIQLLEAKVYPKEKAWIFCHNYNFDALTLDLFTNLKQAGYEIKRWVIDSDMFIVLAKKDTKTLAFIDTFNYFKTSIAKMGEQVKLPKLEANFKTMNDSELMIYCKRDSEILMSFMEQFINWWHASDYGNFRYTLASLALEAYRHKFMPYDIWLHDNEEAQMLEIDSYRGGRVEAFFIGNPPAKEYYKLDINSQYPAVMLEESFPVALVDVRENYPIHALKNLLASYLVTADVSFVARDNALGVRRERLLFPTGKIRCTLTTPELRYLQLHGRIDKIHKIAYYRHAPIFKTFISEIYEKRLAMRSAGATLYDTFLKLIMNSLYGKFGQQNQEYECIGDSWLEQNCIQYVMTDDATKRRTEIHLNGKVYIVKGKELAHTAFVAIAAHIVAYARMKLWKYMRVAGYGNFFYVDTDSLFTNKLGRDNLENFIDASKLGYLKQEAVSDYLEIRNAKDYTFGKDTKRKGIRKDAEQVDAYTFRQLRFSKIRSMLQNGNDNSVIISQIEKHLSPEYKKGIVDTNGWVTPFKLSDY